jgi:peptidoglycan hydrolase-like protein with peptidoglycan-binding domain
MELSRFAVLPLLLVFVVSPAFAAAQSTTTPAEGWNMPTDEVQQYIRGWRRQSSELQQKINVLPSVADAAVFMPVLFGVGVKNISPNFGDPRDGGTRTHIGEDIMAVKGTPIVSPTAAVVIRTGVGSGQGNYITTANPGGETFVYMHLDRFGEGVTVGTVLEQGSLIGYVGNTGNASGGAAHLHLEIHNSSGVATDPFPRLIAEFTPTQKMSYLTNMFGQTTDPVALSEFLVANFRPVFTAAASAGVILPPLITGALDTVSALPPASGTGVSVPPGDLMLGSRGTAVVNLQTFLIAKATGSAATRLAAAGATGYFGPITQAALVEYQNAAGISPASGYYGPSTRSLVEAAFAAQTTPLPIPQHTPLILVPGTSAAGGGVLALTRNLSIGVSGEDVRALQKFLNAQGYTVALSGAGSPGNETAYFGPATRAAVVKFQIAHSIVPAVGYVGPITRAAFATD